MADTDIENEDQSDKETIGHLHRRAVQAETRISELETALAEAQSLLSQVRKLPQDWRDMAKSPATILRIESAGLEHCADELERTIAGQPDSGESSDG